MAQIYDTIIEHHDELRDLMKTMSSERSETEERESAFKEFAVGLEAHAGAEERFLYSPVLMNDEGLEKTRHANKEHEEASELIKKMKELKPDGDAFFEKAKELVKEVRHHMEEEEGEYFRVSEKVLSDDDASRLNDQYVSDFERLREKFAREA